MKSLTFCTLYNVEYKRTQSRVSTLSMLLGVVGLPHYTPHTSHLESLREDRNCRCGGIATSSGQSTTATQA